MSFTLKTRLVFFSLHEGNNSFPDALKKRSFLSGSLKLAVNIWEQEDMASTVQLIEVSSEGLSGSGITLVPHISIVKERTPQKYVLFCVRCFCPSIPEQLFLNSVVPFQHNWNCCHLVKHQQVCGQCTDWDMSPISWPVKYFSCCALKMSKRDPTQCLRWTQKIYQVTSGVPFPWWFLFFIWITCILPLAGYLPICRVLFSTGKYSSELQKILDAICLRSWFKETQ